jgi:phosphomevalonate kinase
MIISKKSNLSNCHLLFQTVFEASVKARALLKKMGKLANVDIEPENQSSILYDTLNVPGVLMAGVPGAGGNDAVFCLILDKEVRPHVCSLWEKHGITPLNCHVNSKGITVAHY